MNSEKKSTSSVEIDIISDNSTQEDKYQNELNTLRQRLEEELKKKEEILNLNAKIEEEKQRELAMMREELTKNQIESEREKEIILAEKKALEEKFNLDNLREAKVTLNSRYLEDKMEEEANKQRKEYEEKLRLKRQELRPIKTVTETMNSSRSTDDRASVTEACAPLRAQYIDANLGTSEVKKTFAKMAPLNAQYIEREVEMVLKKKEDQNMGAIDVEQEESSLKSVNLKDAKLIKSNLKKPNEPSTHSSGSSINHWKGVYKTTIDKWLSSVNEMSQVYQTALEKYRERTRWFSTTIFIISSLTNLVTISQFITVSTEIELTIKIGIIFINFIVTTLSGILRLYEWNKKVEEYTTYLQKLDDFFAALMNELTLPPKMRKDAEDFILQFKDQYFDVIKSAPDIDQGDYLEGLKKQNEFIEQKTENFLAKKRQRIQELV